MTVGSAGSMTRSSAAAPGGEDGRAAQGRECRLCGGASAKAFALTVLGKYRVDYCRCERCGSLQTETPHWLDEAYTLNLSHLDTGAANRNIDNLAVCYAVARLFRLKNAIDVGGGDGLLCRLLRDHGIHCFVRDKYAEPTYAQGFTRPDFQRPDLVIASEVIEHYARPREELDELFGLQPHVLLVTTTLFTGQGPDWWYLAPESGQHVFFYSREALELVAAKHGYTLLTSGAVLLFVRKERLRASSRWLARLLLNGRMRRIARAAVLAQPARGAWSDHVALKDRTPMRALPESAAARVSREALPTSGYRLPAQSSSAVLVVGTVRNCAERVGAQIARMGAALGGFARVQWLLIESDSTDASVSRLQELAGRDGDFSYISLGALRERMPLRTERIAYCRNAYLDQIRTNERYAAVEFVVVADFDDVNSLLTGEAVASCWRRDDWHVCAANQRGHYYDIWALRHADWSPNDCWEQYRFLTRHGLSHARAWSACVRARMLHISPEAQWIEVDSAFGGLAIYRKAALQHGQYVGSDAQGGECCEHVALHHELRAQGCRIFINPALINGDSPDHTDSRLMERRVTRAIGRMMRRVTT